MTEKNIPFSPPSINQEDINNVIEVLKSKLDNYWTKN